MSFIASHCDRSLARALLLVVSVAFSVTGCLSEKDNRDAVGGSRSTLGGSSNSTQSNVASQGGMGTAPFNGGASQGGAVSASGASQTGGTSMGFRTAWVEEWDRDTIPNFYARGDAPNSVNPNVLDSSTRDGHALSLTLGANSQSTPSSGAEVGTNARFAFGSFASRLRTANCTGQPDAGVVTGLFTYFKDGTDTTGDGLPDNSEIDFEWLCAEPQTVYLTMWTDYRDSDAAQQRVGRAINLSTGNILYTCYFSAFGDCNDSLVGVEAMPNTVPAVAGYDSSAAYYEYGFDWAADSVVWWMVNPTSGEKIVLWNYQGPIARITQVPAAFLTNVWHTSDWSPINVPNAISAPTQAVTAWVDWLSYTDSVSAENR